MRRAALTAGALALLAFCGPARPQKPAAPEAPAHVWWEAEAFSAGDFPAANPFAPATPAEADVLSGGRWIGVEGARTRPLFLEYRIRVPRTGAYTLYARKFWKHGPFRWRIDDGPWQAVGPDPALLDDTPLRQFVGANWVAAGAATVRAGERRVRIELTTNTGAAAFDCFCLATGPFAARGKLLPGQSWNRTEPGWFAFEPAPDPFAPTPLDLRFLNERRAGDGGFVARRGDRLVHARTGAPARFWAVNAGPDLLALPPAAMATLARGLAKRGVNLVRVHGALWKGDDFARIDRERLDGLHAFVAALKREGIYTALSIYFPLWPERVPFDGYAPGKKPFGLLFFHPEFQKIYRGWWRAILTTPNPHAGGLPLARDPAVAVAELVNEDSLFFWTFTPYENVPAPQMALLERRFGAWLARRHGSVAKALAAWGGPPVRGDDPAAGRAGFRPLWELANRPDRRSRETAEFLARLQRAFFDREGAHLKKTLRFGGCVVGSNWITADARVLGPLDKWSNAGLDAMDRHGYFEGRHDGDGASYSLRVGHVYEDRSALRWEAGKDAPALPLFDLRWNGLPSLLSEVNWPAPNRFRAEMPFLAAALGSLQGSDALMFFALSGPDWQQTHAKFGIQTPAVLGQFPAAALIYRQGLLRAPAPVVDAPLAMADLWALRGAPVAAPLALDALRAADVPETGRVSVERLPAIDPMAFAVGPVRVSATERGGPARVAPLPRFVDRKARTVRSATGEFFWDGAAGRAWIAAPRATGVAGFLGGSPAALPDAVFDLRMEYGAALLVSLDGLPVARSRKMLLQVMSEDRNWGWRTDRPDGARTIRSLGAAPILVREMSGTVRLTRADAARLTATPLDANGYPAGPPQRADRIVLRPDVLYYAVGR